MAKSIVEVSNRTLSELAPYLDWILGDRQGMDTYKTRMEVWVGVYTWMYRSGVVSGYGSIVNTRTTTEQVAEFFSDPDGFLTSMGSWVAGSGAARMTWVLNRIMLGGFGWGPNAWRTKSRDMSRSVSMGEHADRGGTSTQQGADRLMHDHAGAYQTPNTGLESEEEYQSVLSRIEPEHRTILLEYATAVHGEKSSVAKRHGLTGPELSNLVNKYRTKLAK